MRSSVGGNNGKDGIKGNCKMDKLQKINENVQILSYLLNTIGHMRPPQL